MKQENAYKIKLLKLLEILRQDSDEDHYIGTTELIDKLADMIRFVCPHCGTITISKEKSRRHIQIDMYAPKGEVLQSRIEY